MDRFIIQEMNISGVTHYEIIDTENKCMTVYKSKDYVKAMEALKQYNTDGKTNKKVEVSICHINILSDFLQILQKENYKVLRENGFEIEYTEGLLQEWINDILNNFCKPLIEYDKDTEIILNN